MGSGKTLNLLAVDTNYAVHGKTTLLITPRIDTRNGVGNVQSRLGLSRKSDIVVDYDTKINYELIFNNVGEGCNLSAVLVDECQFLSAEQVNSLREIVDSLKIPVLCFGLRTDFQTKLFPGSKRLMEVADSIEELKTLCSSCLSKSIFNFRYSSTSENGNNIVNPVWEGPQVSLEGKDFYKALCSKCYRSYMQESNNDWNNLPWKY